MSDAERFDKINDRIGELDEGGFFSLYSSYEQYLEYGTKNVFENICKAFGFVPEDFVFWYNYDVKENVK